MKFICLGYYDEAKFMTRSEQEQQDMMDACFAYDKVLKNNGHMVGGEGLDLARNARTVHWKNGKATVTDGPFAETKEVLGGFIILEARDLDHAVELMSNHPGIKIGPFEIRMIADMTAVIQESEQRRAK